MTNSVFTSWTSDISVARQQFAGGNGVVFAVEPNKMQNIIIDTASFSRKPAEREFLIQGPLFRVKRLQ